MDSPPIHLNNIFADTARSAAFSSVAEFVDAAVWWADAAAVDTVEDEEETYQLQGGDEDDRRNERDK